MSACPKFQVEILPDGSVVTHRGFVFSAIDSDLAALNWSGTKGYARIKRCQKIHYAHRWVLERMIGRKLTPEDICDHINGDPSDNRRFNLRLTDRCGNSQNVARSSSRSKAGFRNVHLTPHGTFQVKIKFRRVTHYAGVFDTAESAFEAARALRQSLGVTERGSRYV